MKTMAMTIMILMAGTVANGESAGLQVERKVTVCVDGMGMPWVAGADLRARAIASQIFDNIGVTVHWRRGLAGCPAQAIRISLIQNAPDSLNSGAVAYALPYERSHICVFFDRIQQSSDRSQVSVVLGYILVHEITHILQGIARHSASGIMKARWDLIDYRNMKWGSLGLEANDIQLIYLGLGRAAGTTFAINAPGRCSMDAGQ